MLMRFGQAAMLAAILVLSINSARAEDAPAKGGCADCCCKDGKCCKADKTAKTECDCCKDGKCCKADKTVKTECKCACGSRASKCCKDAACCKTGKCCSKDGACCKDGKCECCKAGKCACGSKDGKCGKSCACGKDTASCKCEGCCKDGKCCQAGACCASKACCQGACGCSCCSAVNKPAAKAPFMHPIIVVLPMPMGGPAMPVCAGCPAGCSTVSVPMPPPPSLTPPVMPPQTIAMPVPPLPPCYGSCPVNPPVCAPLAYPPVLSKAEVGVDYLSILGMVTDLCCAHTHPPTLPTMCMAGLGMVEDLCSMMSNNRTATEVGGAYVPHPPQYAPPMPPPPPARTAAVLPPPTPVDGPYPLSSPPVPMMTCSAATPAPAALKVRIVAKPDSDQLEMNVDDACVTCKKMVVKVGDSSLMLTRMDGRVRIRTEELRAKANCVRTDRKDRLVLEGDVELRLNKDGRSANVTAERIELNLTSGTITIQSMGRLERVGVDFNQP